MHRSLPVALAALVLTVAPAGATDAPKDAPTKSALASAKKSFSVFKARKKSADAIPAARKLESRRLGSVAGQAAYAAVVRGNMELRLGRVSISKPVAQAARSELAILNPGLGDLTLAVLVADGARDAKLVAADGTATALKITRNAILTVARPGGRLEWTRKDGSTGSYALRTLPPLGL